MRFPASIRRLCVKVIDANSDTLPDGIRVARGISHARQQQRRRNLHEHIHTGFANVVFAGVSAIIVIQCLRLGSAWLVSTGKGESAGRIVGALVNFG